MTDEDCWDLIIKFDPLIKNRARNLVPNEYYEDVVQELRILVYRGLKAGYLERGSIESIVNFARSRARNLVVAKVPVITIPIYILQAIKIFKKAHETQSLDPVRNRVKDSEDTLHAIGIAVELAESYGAYTWTIDPNDEKIRDPESVMDIQEYEMAQFADTLIESIMEGKGHSSKKGLKAYIFARYFSLEEKILERHEEAMGDYGVLLREVVEEEQRIKEDFAKKNPMGPDSPFPSKVTLQFVSDEVDLTRERVRQILIRGLKHLYTKIDE